MNPRSGGGKVTRFGLQDKAQALGAQVALLEGPGTVDVAALARQAVADGADLLGVAGGDGTQALVAGIAAEHHLPFLVISAGWRRRCADLPWPGWPARENVTPSSASRPAMGHGPWRTPLRRPVTPGNAVPGAHAAPRIADTPDPAGAAATWMRGMGSGR
jgi:hypothetical protein